MKLFEHLFQVVFICTLSITCVRGSYYFIGGATTPEQPSLYPPANPPQPGSRYAAATWNVSGAIYIYGGYCYGLGDTYGDMWKLSMSSHTWSYVMGPTTNPQNPNSNYDYTKGAVLPGGRYSAAAWSYNNNLYMFGGYGNGASSTGELGDMWTFVMSSNKWFYLLRASSPAVAAAPVYSGRYNPGSRSESATWTDSANGYLYLFGGKCAGQLACGDMWKYSVAAEAWTFVGGYQSSATSQISVANSQPGARTGAATWRDPISGYFFMYGGIGSCTIGGTWTVGFLNDFWCYHPTTNMWYNVNGNFVCSVPLVNTSSVAYPGNRAYSVAWYDSSLSSFILFGGYGQTTNDPSLYGELFGDTWVFSLTSRIQKWVLKDGPIDVNAAPIYTGANERPGARCYASGAYDSVHDSYLLFGGSGEGELNDLWEYFYF